jgi:hypothetical protein
MFKYVFVLLLLLIATATASAQEIKVNPIGVDVDGQAATTAFLTFGPVKNYLPADACWCGDIVPAAPGVGFKCNLTFLFGCLPARYDHSSASGQAGFTDIMSVPASVARRAYQDAQAGADSRFFYVRHFVSTSGGPDQFVPVTCRLTGGGARSPLSLTDVKLSFNDDRPVLFVKPGEKTPEIRAEIGYTGTGRLVGRWEVVFPGENPPAQRDLLTEGSLPIEQRASQRRYSELSRFNVFLPPTGKYTLAGPDASKLPTAVEGPYLLLLRVEASDDKEGDSDLTAVDAGPAVVHSGAVAGFPLPALRYYVGAGGSIPQSLLVLVSPGDNEALKPGSTAEFRWNPVSGTALYKVDVSSPDGDEILSALLTPAETIYRAPSWLRDKAAGAGLRWRVMALDQVGNPISESNWRRLRVIR